MPISLMRDSKNNAMHGTDNGKFTGCRMKISAAFTREGELKEITDLTCDRCKEVFATKMIRESNREDARMEKEERQRFKRAKKQGIVQEATYEEYIHNREVEASSKKAAHDKSVSMSLAELKAAIPQEEVPTPQYNSYQQSNQFQSQPLSAFSGNSPVQAPFDPYAQTASPVQAPFDPYAQQASPVQAPFDPYAQQASPVQAPFDPYKQQSAQFQSQPLSAFSGNSPVQAPFDPYKQQSNQFQSQPLSAFGGNTESPVQAPFDPYKQQVQSQPLSAFGGNAESPVQAPFDPYAQQTASPQVPIFDPFAQQTSVPQPEPVSSSADDGPAPSYQAYTKGYDGSPASEEKPSSPVQSASDDDFLAQFMVKRPEPEQSAPVQPSVTADTIRNATDDILSQFNITPPSSEPETSGISDIKADAASFYSDNVPVVDAEYAVSPAINPDYNTLNVPTSLADDFTVPDVPVYQPYAKDSFSNSSSLDEIKTPDVSSLRSAAESLKNFSHQFDELTSEDNLDALPPVSSGIETVPTLQPNMFSDDFINSFDDTPSQPSEPTADSLEAKISEVPTLSSFEPVAPAVPETPTLSSFEPVAPAVPEVPTLSSFEPVAPAVPETPTLSSFEPVAPAVPETPTLSSFEPVAPAVPEVPTLSSFTPIASAEPEAPKEQTPVFESYTKHTAPAKPSLFEQPKKPEANASPVQAPFDPYKQQAPVQSQPLSAFGGNAESPVQAPFDPYKQQAPVQSQPLSAFGGNAESPVQAPFDPYKQQAPVQSQPLSAFGGNTESPVQAPFDPYKQQAPVQSQPLSAFGGNAESPVQAPFDPYKQQSNQFQSQPLSAFGGNAASPVQPPFDPYKQQQPVQSQPQAPVYKNFESTPTVQPAYDPYAQQATPMQAQPVMNNGYGVQSVYSQPVNPYAMPQANNFSQPVQPQQNMYQPQMPANNGMPFGQPNGFGNGLPPQAFGKAVPPKAAPAQAVIEPGNTADSVEEALRMFGIETASAEKSNAPEKEEITPDYVAYVPSSSKVLHTAPPSNSPSSPSAKRPVSAREAKQLAKIDAKFKKDLQSRGFNPNEVRSQRRGK